MKIWKLIFSLYIVGMAMDEETARQDVASLCALLGATTPKGKKSSKHKEKPNEERIIFENLEQYPFVMWQSAWELRWDRVHVLYKTRSGITALVLDDSVIAQWSSKASLATNPQRSLGSEDPDTLYTHAVLLSLTPLCILKVADCCEQGDHGTDPVQFVYSTVVVFVHPAQVLSSFENAVDFYELQRKLILQGSHSSGWCILCKQPHYETSQYFPAIPHQPFLVLPITPDAWPQLCLDSTSCDADCMLIWMLHRIQHHNTDYAMMPLAFRTSLMLPWEIRMEEYPKLWENEVFITWKAGSPGVDVGLAMNFVGTCRTEYDTQRIILDISDAMIICYPAAQVDEEDVGDSTGEIPDDNDDDDDDDDDVDEDIQQTATEIGTKSDDSSFHGTGVGSTRINALMGPGVKCMGETPFYQVTALAISSRSGMHTVSRNVEAARQSFDTFIKHHAVCSPQEGPWGIHHDQRDHAEVCWWYGHSRPELHSWRHHVWRGAVVVRRHSVCGCSDWYSKRITELIREASELEVVYEESQKKFTGVLKQVEEEVGKYLETQSMADSTVFMDESFDNLRRYLNLFNISPFVPVVVGTVVTHHALLTSLQVNVSHFPLKIFLSPLESDATTASGQTALLQYMTQQSIAIWEGQAKMVPALRANTGDTDLTIELDHSYTAPQSWRLKPQQSAIAPSIQDKKEAHSSKDLGPPPPPLPPMLPAKEPHTPKGKDAHMSGLMAALMMQFQQRHDSQSWEVTPHSMPEKVLPMVSMAFSTLGKVATPRETPTKETPRKSEQTPPKKDLTLDTTHKPLVKKQWTGSPSRDQGDYSKHGDASENKKNPRSVRITHAGSWGYW